MGTIDRERNRDESRGAFHERIGVAMAVEHLDKVITPLEDMVRVLDRAYGRTSPFETLITAIPWREEGKARQMKKDKGRIQTADTLVDVIRTLRRGKGIDAMTSITGGLSRREEIVTLQKAGPELTGALYSAMVGEEGEEILHTPPDSEGLHGGTIYSTKARGLYLEVEATGRTSSTVKLFAAKPEDVATHGFGKQEPQ